MSEARLQYQLSKSAGLSAIAPRHSDT